MARSTNNKTTAVAKATNVAKAVQKGVKSKATKVRTSPHFFRPKTQTFNRSPKAPEQLVRKSTKFDDYRIIKTPLTSESALKKVELHNTIVFLCDPEATKPQIRAAVARRFKVKVVKCNTLMRMDGQKKAFVKLHPDNDALDVANKIGIL